MMPHALRNLAIPAYLLACLLLGGASAAGFWANMALQLAAVGILFWAVIVRRETPMSTPGRQLLTLLGLAVALVLIQLVPLPPALWTKLPGREPVVEGFAMLGQPLPWLPISLSPYRTLASALWMLPACAVLFGIVRVGAFKTQLLVWSIPLVAILSVAVGALQIGGGEGSPWYFYRITNVGQTTGFFANANHLATLLLATLPFLAALYLQARAKGRSLQRTSGMFVVLAGAVTVVLFGLAMNGSTAGLGLSVPVLAATTMMVLSRRRRLPRWTLALVALLVAGSVAAAFTAPFGNNLTTNEARISENSRYTSFTRTLDAAADYMPFGSGIGSFPEIYPSRENPATVDRWYMNHVHGDYIELALETGVPGILIIILFLLWWARRAAAVWSAEEPDYFARAATIASAAMLAHSIVDYPLRTAAISALFAMCCALMAEPRPRAQSSRAKKGEDKPAARHLSAD